MTPLEVVLLILCGVFVFVIWAQNVVLTDVQAELNYTRELYADAIAQLEAVTASRDYYKREWAVRWDARAEKAE